MSDWFYTVMGEELGPVSGQELQQLARSGQIDEGTPVRQRATGKVATAGKIKGLFDGQTQQVSVRPPQRPVEDTKPCPFCAQQILVQAVKCQHCGEMLDPTLRAAAESRQADKNPMVFMNAGGAAASASAASAASSGRERRPFNHMLHLVLTLLTCGMWLPVWILLLVLHKP